MMSFWSGSFPRPNGSAEEIYIRCADTIWSMISAIIDEELKPSPQPPHLGTTPEWSPWEHEILGKIKLEDHLQITYDTIRMFDADTYPKAFMELGNTRLEFSRAQMRHDGIVAEVKITKKG